MIINQMWHIDFSFALARGRKREREAGCAWVLWCWGGAVISRSRRSHIINQLCCAWAAQKATTGKSSALSLSLCATVTLWLLWHFVWIVTRLTAQCCLIALANKTSCENFNEWRRHRQGHCHSPPTKMWIPRTNWRSLGAQFQWTLINRPLDTDADAGYTACHGYARRVQHKHTEIQNHPFHSLGTHTHPVQYGWLNFLFWFEPRTLLYWEKC